MSRRRRERKATEAAVTSSAPPRVWPWALTLAALAFLLYLPSLGSGFVYDAEAQILIDDYVHQPAHLVDVVTLRVLGQDVLDGNRPMQLLSLMVDALLWGRWPAGFHFTSNALHAVNTALVFLLMVRLGARRRETFLAAAAAALVFAAHPVLVEPVAEVSSREDPLAAFFFLVSLLLAFRWTEAPARPAWAVGCAAAVFFSCASKESGLAAPFAILLAGLLFRGATPLRRWLEIFGITLAVAVAFLAARFLLQPSDSEVFLYKPPYLGGSFWTVFQVQPSIWAFQVRSVFQPVFLSADYVAYDVRAIPFRGVVAWLGIFLTVQILAAWKSRMACFGVAVFWLGLAPVSNFVPIFRPVADRYLYLPLIGIALMLCGLLLVAADRPRVFRGVVGLAGALIAGLVMLSWERQAVFANSLNLWTDTVAKSPASDTGANNLGYARLEAQDYPGALEAFDRALKLTDYRKPNAWAGAAIALEALGRTADARHALDRAITLDPTYADPDKLVRSMQVSRKQADVLRRILDRSPE